MTTLIGPSFIDDLKSEGLNVETLAVSWMPDGTIIGLDDLDATTKTKVQQAFAKHDPLKQANVVATSVMMVAMAELQINAGEIFGVDLSVNISAAVPVDMNVIWIFFANPPQTGYIPFVQAPGCNVDVTDRQSDYFELTVTSRTNNAPVMPSLLSISVQKVI